MIFWKSQFQTILFSMLLQIPRSLYTSVKFIITVKHHLPICFYSQKLWSQIFVFRNFENSAVLNSVSINGIFLRNASARYADRFYWNYNLLCVELRRRTLETGYPSHIDMLGNFFREEIKIMDISHFFMSAIYVPIFYRNLSLNFLSLGNLQICYKKC